MGRWHPFSRHLCWYPRKKSSIFQVQKPPMEPNWMSKPVNGDKMCEIRWAWMCNKGVPMFTKNSHVHGDIAMTLWHNSWWHSLFGDIGWSALEFYDVRMLVSTRIANFHMVRSWWILHRYRYVWIYIYIYIYTGIYLIWLHTHTHTYIYIYDSTCCRSHSSSYLGKTGKTAPFNKNPHLPRSCLAYFWVQIFSYTDDVFSNVEAKVSIFRQGISSAGNFGSGVHL